MIAGELGRLIEVDDSDNIEDSDKVDDIGDSDEAGGEPDSDYEESDSSDKGGSSQALLASGGEATAGRAISPIVPLSSDIVQPDPDSPSARGGFCKPS